MPVDSIRHHQKCDTSSSTFLSAALRARVHATCSCPDGFHPKNLKRISYNGCGPDGDGSFVDDIKGTLIRSGLIGEKNKKCCNHHDVCYATAMADWGKCNERQSVCIGDDTINVIQDVAVSSSAGQEAFVAAQKAFVVCAYGKSEDSFDTAYATAWHNAHVESDRNLKKPIETAVLTAANTVLTKWLKVLASLSERGRKLQTQCFGSVRCLAETHHIFRVPKNAFSGHTLLPTHADRSATATNRKMQWNHEPLTWT